MNVFRFSFIARLLPVFAAAIFAAMPAATRAQDFASGDAQAGSASPQDPQQDVPADPPSRVGRISIMQGNVSYQPAISNDFSAAELNYPLTTGDRLYTGNSAQAEIDAGQLAVRLGEQTDFTVITLSDEVAQFGLAQGSVHLHAFELDANAATELDTSNASIAILEAGDVRVDVLPDDVTIVTVLSGQAQVTTDSVQQTLEAGQNMQISGLEPSNATMIGAAHSDDLDRFSSQRDVSYQQAVDADESYVDPDTIGSVDLASFGDWDSSSPEFGNVWYPRGVSADWAPYSNGRWIWIAPWGWTWVGAEPWGFAPFHYGRWNRFGNRWGWIPGPPRIHPWYSPGLVVFVGGSGITGWFPLGPREVYHPWYRTSPAYVNRVNVTNIYNRNRAAVRSIYNNRSSAYGNMAASYVNRSAATTAIPQRNFGSGRSVRTSLVKLDASQIQAAPILTHSPAAPPQQAVARIPARALPPRVARTDLGARSYQNRNAQQGDGFSGSSITNGGRPSRSQSATQPGRENNLQPGVIVRRGYPQPNSTVRQPTNGQIEPTVHADPGRRPPPDGSVHTEPAQRNPPTTPVERPGNNRAPEPQRETPQHQGGAPPPPRPVPLPRPVPPPPPPNPR